MRQHGVSWLEADQYLRSEIIAEDANAIYVPPFDHHDIWEGVSSMVDETAEQLLALTGDARPDGVVCSVGGGGLFSGIMLGLNRKQWSSVPVVAVETFGAASLNASLVAKKHVTLPAITSLATSLAATRVAAQTYAYGQQPNVSSVVLSDGDAIDACVNFADDERMLVELACGASIATCYHGTLRRTLAMKSGKPWAEERVVIVVCGGQNVTTDMFSRWKAENATRKGPFREAGTALPNESKADSGA